MTTRYPVRTPLALLMPFVLLVACGDHELVPTVDVLATTVTSVPLDPDDPAWARAPLHVSELLLQDMVEPRLLEPSTIAVRVRALTDGRSIGFRLEWDDVTADDLPGSARHADACAVQVAREPGPDLPAPQMGESGRTVEIAMWRASWQAVVDGRGDTIRDLHPNAAVDHYPFEAGSLDPGSPEQLAMQRRYAPARALDNPMAGPRDTPAQALVAAGPGTLSPDPSQAVDARGRWAEGRWSVVLTRPVPSSLEAGTHVAFAVWEGSHGEAGARKMRTGWVALSRSGT